MVSKEEQKKIEKSLADFKKDHSFFIKDFMLNGVLHVLYKDVFEPFLCKGKQDYYDIPSHKEFSEICTIMYNNHFKKFAKRKELNSYNSDDKNECASFIKDKVLFTKFGKFTVIEGLLKNKEKLLLKNVKKHYKSK